MKTEIWSTGPVIMARRKSVIVFGLGMFTMAMLFLYVSLMTNRGTQYIMTYNLDDVNPMVNQPKGIRSTDTTRSYTRNQNEQNTNNQSNCTENITAQKLAEEIRILCMVLTCHDMLENRTVFIKQTWGKRCNKIAYISEKTDTTFPTVGISGVGLGRKYLTQKVLRGVRYMYETYFENNNEFDWLFVVDDDTYAIMENLRYFLRDKDPERLEYYGQKFKPFVPGGFTTGGAGTVIGRGTLNTLFASTSEPVTKCLNKTGDNGDVSLSTCLDAIGAVIGKTTDRYGNTRFHHYSPGTQLGKAHLSWYKHFDADGAQHGVETISDYTISFHYIIGPMMLEYDYFLYHLRPFGLTGEDLNLNMGASIMSNSGLKEIVMALLSLCIGHILNIIYNL